MANLAIRGHATRGREVIELLEMLGGKNQYGYVAYCKSMYFYIDEETRNINCDRLDSPTNIELLFFTLDEFLEKYPYKVGDKVAHKEKNNTETVTYIKGMEWNGSEILYKVDYGVGYLLTEIKANRLRPYKEEETMEEKRIPPYMDYDVRTKETIGEELIPKIDFSKYCKDKYLLDMGDYEIKVEDGKTYVVRKKPKYPKTYKECCEVLCCKPIVGFAGLDDDEENLYGNFIALKRCRNAYWKIVGDWKYDVNKTEEYFYIVNKCGRIVKEHYMNFNHILAFPTEEMRDAFFENFKDLIEQCKELL